MVETKEWVLQVTDRCDGPSCSAQAYVKAIGVSGEIFFCGHHYKTYGGDKLSAFAYEVIDERERLIENRLIGSEN
jgi:hypothetical protein